MAFTNVGIDTFGPIITTIGRRNEKRWGILFTCLTTRAVHLEMAYSLSGESCIKCVENFVNRRGKPKVIRSDNGTNFVYAARIIAAEWNDGPEWKFIPPPAPHQGGAWERLVRSVKRALKDMKMPQKVNDEELQNFLGKAEALINARPLTEIPNHPWHTALTPNHFLLGNANGTTDTFLDETEQTYSRLLQDREEQQRLIREFWDRWSKEYLPLIAARTKWKHPSTPLKTGDLVFICEPNGWIRGVVEDTLEDPETQQVREVSIRTRNKTYRRPTTKVAKIWTEQRDRDAEEPTEYPNIVSAEA